MRQPVQHGAAFPAEQDAFAVLLQLVVVERIVVLLQQDANAGVEGGEVTARQCSQPRDEQLRDARIDKFMKMGFTGDGAELLGLN